MGADDRAIREAALLQPVFAGPLMNDHECSSAHPRVCFVGPMLGHHPGWVTTQGEILADLFAADGWEVRETSSQIRRLVRLIDTIVCLVRWHRHLDLVVVSVFSGAGFVMADVSSLVSRALGLPVVMVLRGGNLPEFRSRHRSWCRRVLARAAVVVAPSAYLVSIVDDAPERVVVVPNVADTAALAGPPRVRAGGRLLWMRTFHPIYNPQLAVDAFGRVVDVHPDATMTLAGQDKGILDEVRAAVDAQPWSTSVHFPGFLDPAAKAEAFATHDIYVHTNRVDNMPVSVLEAAAAGLPVVATRVGGIPDLLTDGETALLVPDDDAEALANAILRLHEDPELASRLSVKGRELAEKSSWPSVRNKWRVVFEKALGDEGAVRNS